MLKNYLKIALRNFVKHKLFSAINIIGLAIGMACSMLIFTYVQNEVSFDNFHEKKERIYRLVLEEKKGDELSQRLFFPAGLPATLKEELPEVEEGIEIYLFDTYVLYNNNHLKAKTLTTHHGFFEIFTFPLLSGNPETVLSEPNNSVISESFAKSHFVGIDPLGQLLYSSETYRDPVSYLITGIMKDIPENSHLQADIVVADAREFEFTNWKESRTFSLSQYLLFSDNTAVNNLEEKLSSFYKKYNFPEHTRLLFQPVTDIHLHSKFARDMQPGGDIRYVYIFTVAALLILLIACINFVNLSTARSLNKAREVGIRKTIGAHKHQLIGQFFTESLLYIIFSFGCAIVFVEIMLPFFSEFYGKSLSIGSLLTFQNVPLITGGILLIGIIAGAYPALFLSSQKPAFILKKVLKASTSTIGFRKILVVFQFSVSIVLIIATLVIFLQLNFISDKHLGFNHEHLIVLPNRNLKNNWEILKQELENNNQITSSTVTDFNIKDYGRGSTRFPDPNDPEKDILFQSTSVDVNFLNTLQAEMLEGRFFDVNYQSDFQGIKLLSTSIIFSDSITKLDNSRSIILNETAVNRLGLQQPLIGKQLNYKGLKGVLIGVIKDFHGRTLHEKIPPLVLYAAKTPEYGNVFIRIQPRNINATLSYVEKTWKSLFPEQPFEFYFYEDSLQQLYLSEKRMGKLFLLFATLGISVACLGLLGLAIFSAEQRVKEIGVRKVLGASVNSIVALLTKDFLKLVLIAFIIGSPIGYYLLNMWLEDFAYKINIDWWILITAGTVSTLIAFFTISFQSIKAALANPVDSLRNE